MDFYFRWILQCCCPGLWFKCSTSGRLSWWSTSTSYGWRCERPISTASWSREQRLWRWIQWTTGSSDRLWCVILRKISTQYCCKSNHVLIPNNKKRILYRFSDSWMSFIIIGRLIKLMKSVAGDFNNRKTIIKTSIGMKYDIMNLFLLWDRCKLHNGLHASKRFFQIGVRKFRNGKVCLKVKVVCH